MHFEIGVVAIRLAGKQRLDLRLARVRLESLEEVDTLLLIAVRRSSSSVRSRMSFCAASALFQRPGSSDFAFSSARRRVAAPTSKMPPQQSHGLLDVGDEGLGFGAHGCFQCIWSTKPI
jgi:hypothetical protein